MRNPCFTFQLNILKTGLDCTFQLNWGERQQLYAELKYPSGSKSLDSLYQDFRYAYENAYNLEFRGRIEEDFFDTNDDIDWKNEAQEKEAEFLNEFDRWLENSELLEIRERILGIVDNQFLNKNKKTKKAYCVTVLIASNAPEIVRLPWESCNLFRDDYLSGKIHLCRTVINAGDELIPLSENPRKGRTRILAILAAEESPEDLNLNQDKKVLNNLEKVADLEIIQFRLEQSVDNFRGELIEKLIDDRGWDALIFGGHSEPTANTGGRLKLASNIYLSLSQIESELILAKDLGLRFALFNSCEGLNIASFLIQLGLHQVIVMREKIYDLVAHDFLKVFIDNLLQYQDVQQVFLKSINYLKKEKLVYPGAYLVPSLFCHPSLDAELFRIEPFRLRRWWRNWKPTKREAITLGVTLLASFIVPIQDLLLEPRFLLQAIYRDVIPAFNTNTEPPVLVVAIDQDSIYEADRTIDNFSIKPIDRELLSQLINQISDFDYNVIGIDYVVDYRQDSIKDEKLLDSIQESCNKKKTSFVFTTKQGSKLLDSITNYNCLIQGNGYIPLWGVQRPETINCFKSITTNFCPLSYALVLIKRLAEERKITFDYTDESLKDKITKIVEVETQSNIIRYFKDHLKLSWGVRILTDFSLNPNQVYQYTTAKEILIQGSDLLKESQGKIVIISSGVYEDIEVYSVPLAINYWCDAKRIFDEAFFRDKRDVCKHNNYADLKDNLTRSQAIAYQIHHWYFQHQIISIHDAWFILLAALLGKWLYLWLYQQNTAQQKKVIYLLVGITIFGTMIAFPLIYLIGEISIPVFLPTVVFWTYILSNSRRLLYV